MLEMSISFSMLAEKAWIGWRWEERQKGVSAFMLSSHLGIGGEGEAVEDDEGRLGAEHGRLHQLLPLFRCQSHSYHTCHIKRRIKL